MEVWLLGIIVLLSGCVTALLVKVYVMQKSAREMEEAFTDRIRSDTNTLIDILPVTGICAGWLLP